MQWSVSSGLMVFSLLLSSSLQAANIVQVVGLFPNAAVLIVDGQREMVRAGEASHSGVEVISTDGQGAQLRVNGEARRYELSRGYNRATQTSARKGCTNPARTCRYK